MRGHTPGLWTWNNYCNDVSPEDPQACVLVSHGTANRGYVPTVEIIELAEDFTIDPANARLIASAPLMLQALEAHQAWTWAEDASPRISTFNENMELCRYANWLTARALAAINGHAIEAEYEGVPHMTVWPTVGIDRAEQDEAQAIVDRILAAYRAATEPKP